MQGRPRGQGKKMTRIPGSRHGSVQIMNLAVDNFPRDNQIITSGCEEGMLYGEVSKNLLPKSSPVSLLIAMLIITAATYRIPNAKPGI